MIPDQPSAFKRVAVGIARYDFNICQKSLFFVRCDLIHVEKFEEGASIREDIGGFFHAVTYGMRVVDINFEDGAGAEKFRGFKTSGDIPQRHFEVIDGQTAGGIEGD